jgi:hypothetical protein
MLTTDDAHSLSNSNRLPLFLMMNCLNGYFEDPLNESLAEALMRNEHGGAIAVWASSGMTFPNEQASINQQLYRTLFGKTNLTLGEQVRFARLATANADVRRLWIRFAIPRLNSNSTPRPTARLWKKRARPSRAAPFLSRRGEPCGSLQQ